MRVAVVVHPRASREELRWDGRELLVWTTRPPVQSAANAAVLRLVAGWLRVPPSHVRLVSGGRARHKVVEVEGIVSLPPVGEGSSHLT
jgi:uncharacterized protein YggU (UPF0235/DUF167 family)